MVESPRELGPKWGDVVYIVAESHEMAMEHLSQRESDPYDSHIYRVVAGFLELLFAGPPQVVRVDKLGDWETTWGHQVREQVERIEAEIRSYEW